MVVSIIAFKKKNLLENDLAIIVDEKVWFSKQFAKSKPNIFINGLKIEDETQLLNFRLVICAN